jgi:hypothetical protein
MDEMQWQIILPFSLHLKIKSILRLKTTRILL